MKTTLILSDELLRCLEARSADSGIPLSGVVEELLRKALSAESRPRVLPRLPSFDAGWSLVDVADRARLHDAMKRR